LASLRVLDIQAVQTVPLVPWSHPFIQRLIGSSRREYSDHLFSWNATDLDQKLQLHARYYNSLRGQQGLDGDAPAEKAGSISSVPIGLKDYTWKSHGHGLFELPIAACMSIRQVHVVIPVPIATGTSHPSRFGQGLIKKGPPGERVRIDEIK
jgi:hypothetical protein